MSTCTIAFKTGLKPDPDLSLVEQKVGAWPGPEKRKTNLESEKSPVRSVLMVSISQPSILLFRFHIHSETVEKPQKRNLEMLELQILMWKGSYA